MLPAVDTFLVRIWVAADGTPGGQGLRGVVRHVASGVETRVRSEEEMLAALRGAASHDPKENDQ
jgi:hypothetical protein